MIPLASPRLVVFHDTTLELVANLRNWKSIVARDPIAQRLTSGNVAMCREIDRDAVHSQVLQFLGFADSVLPSYHYRVKGEGGQDCLSILFGSWTILEKLFTACGYFTRKGEQSTLVFANRQFGADTDSVINKELPCDFYKTRQWVPNAQIFIRVGQAGTATQLLSEQTKDPNSRPPLSDIDCIFLYVRSMFLNEKNVKKVLETTLLELSLLRTNTSGPFARVPLSIVEEEPHKFSPFMYSESAGHLQPGFGGHKFGYVPSVPAGLLGYGHKYEPTKQLRSAMELDSKPSHFLHHNSEPSIRVQGFTSSPKSETTADTIKVSRIGFHVENLGGHMVKNIPNHFTTISVVRKRRLERLSAKAANLDTYLSKGKCTLNDESTRILSAAMTHAAGVPPETAMLIGAQSIKAFLNSANYEHNANDVARVAPGATTLRNTVVNGAVDSLLELGEKLRPTKHFYLSCDKAPSGNFAKCITFYCELTDKVVKFTLDIDSVGGTSEAAADGIFHSMSTKLPIDERTGKPLRLNGQTTDNGSGGVMCSLARALKARGLTKSAYLVANCTLHSIQLSLSSPCEESFGEGGMDNRNFLQLCHCLYSLLSYYEADTTKLIFEKTVQLLSLSKEQHVYQVLVQPIMGRWWYVGKCVKRILVYWDIYKALAQGIVNAVKDTNNKKNKAASDLLSLMKELVLRADMEFIKVYVYLVLNCNFEWLQGTDSVTKEPGFRYREILVRKESQLDAQNAALGSTHISQ